MRAPLRVLCVIPNPTDLPRFDDAHAWNDLKSAFDADGAIGLERLEEPSEGGLKRFLTQGRVDVLHFIVHAQERRAANYGAIALQASDGRARNLTASYLAACLVGSPVKLVVLQACDPASVCFDVVARALCEQNLAVVTAPPLSGKAQQIFVSKLYRGAVAGLAPERISQELSIALSAIDPRPTILSRREKDPIWIDTASPPPEAPAAAPVETPPARPDPWRQRVDQKRVLGEFDVFLCHNSADKPAVKLIARRLMECGLLPWLDAWELPPGQAWQPVLEKQLGTIKSAAVFVGSAGLGPWQEQEMYGLLREFVDRKAPVIPVLLPDAPSKPELPLFLRALTWVDFRSADPDPLSLLVWGITGKRPEERSATLSES
jgi:hypothetical protein